MRPLILVTNDDGIQSPGLQALAEVADEFADTIVVGPIKQQTGMGRSFPRHADDGIIQTFNLNINNKAKLAYGVYGSPAYVVSHALLELVDRKPDLCISGINYGENLGLSLTCSGTVGAALEANSHGIHAIAFSKAFDLDKQNSENYEKLNFDLDKKFIRKIIEKFLNRPFPPKICLYNVNIPQFVDINTKIQMTRQSKMNYSVFDKVPPRDMSKPYRLKSSISTCLSCLEHNSDIYTVVVKQNISVTPIRWDISIDDKIEF